MAKGYIYLIGQRGQKGQFKIGVTRGSVEKRLKQLQTGSSDELYIKETFESDNAFKLEKMLHNQFSSKNMLNEWYQLEDDDVSTFKEKCEQMQGIIDSLAENPFF